MVLLGIDPGLAGALAIVSAPLAMRVELVAVIDVPVTDNRRVDALKVMDFIGAQKPDRVVIERAQSMPFELHGRKQGGSSGFNYGRAVGYLECAVIGMTGRPPKLIEATGWKKYHGLLKMDKEASRQKALALFPAAGAYLARKMDHNRAEAILIAAYGVALHR